MSRGLRRSGPPAAPCSALLLGGTSEIGLATLRALVPGGLDEVVLAARDTEAAAQAAAELRQLGVGSVAVLPFEATDTPPAVAAIDEAFRVVGGFDVVVLAFGALGEQATFDDGPEVAGRLVEINFAAGVTASLAVARRLRAQGRGTLVVLSSVAGVRVRRANFVYGSSKAGLDAFALGLGDALAGSGAGVLVVRPGFVTGRMTEGWASQPFPTTPEAVAAATVEALRAGRQVVWVPGILRWAFVVLRLLPRPLWRLVSGR